MMLVYSIKKEEIIMNNRTDGTIEKAYFEIGDVPKYYAGYTNGDTWNGWQCPMFEKRTADKYMEDYNESMLYKASYNKETDTYSFEMDINDPENIDEFVGFDIIYAGLPVHVYAIGAFCWVWDMLELPEHDIRMNFARFIAEANDKIFDKYGDTSDCIAFEFEGMHIHNPFISECGRFDEDPVEYYGKAFLNSRFYNDQANFGDMY
jgi:hypothetical protein